MSARVSAVIPAYNEAAVIETVLTELGDIVISRLTGAEAIVVDDASTDGTGAILDRLAADHDWLQVEHEPLNHGHGPAVSRAVHLSSGDWIFQFDSDHQFEIADFWRLWESRGEGDLILGVRRKRESQPQRVLLSRALSLLVSLIGGRRLSDPNTPFRIFRRSLWEELEPLIGESPLVPSTLLSLGAAAGSRRIVEIPVSHRRRPHGRSSLRGAGLLIFCFRALFQLLSFRARCRRAKRSSSRG
jgi:glycosyltransferase involved in cell wall biosynthesis